MSKALGFVPASYNLTGELNIPKDQKQYVDAIKNITAGKTHTSYAMLLNGRGKIFSITFVIVK